MIAATALAAAALLGPTVADFDTPIGRAAAACRETVPDREFFEMDEGHSVRIDEFADVADNTIIAPAVRCFADELDLPDWIFAQMDFVDVGSVDVPGYTVSWRLSGESFFVSQFLIYDVTVGGGSSLPDDGAPDFQEEAEKYIESARFTTELEERIGERVEFTNAVCDRPESTEVGTRYGCTADADIGTTWTFEVEITDDDALTVTAAQPGP